MKHSSASAEVRFRFGSILFMEIALFKFSLGHPLFFFSPFSVVPPTQILSIFKTRSNDVVKPFFT